MNIEIRTMPIDALQAHPGNPRTTLRPRHDPEFDAIKTSLDRFGLVEPIVWNERTNKIVSGHQRVRVLRHENIAEVDVAVVRLDEHEEAALLLAMNKIQGRWDEDKLAEILDSIEDPFAIDIPDISVEDTAAMTEKRYLCDECGTVWYE